MFTHTYKFKSPNVACCVTTCYIQPKIICSASPLVKIDHVENFIGIMWLISQSEDLQVNTRVAVHVLSNLSRIVNIFDRLQ